MKSQELELYHQEILELTDLLHSEWHDLKDLLTDGNINIDDAYLVAYMEDENDGAEHGVILTSDKKFIRFAVIDDEITLQPILDPKTLEEEFPTVTVAMKLFI